MTERTHTVWAQDSAGTWKPARRLLCAYCSNQRNCRPNFANRAKADQEADKVIRRGNVRAVVVLPGALTPKHPKVVLG